MPQPLSPVSVGRPGQQIPPFREGDLHRLNPWRSAVVLTTKQNARPRVRNAGSGSPEKDPAGGPRGAPAGDIRARADSAAGQKRVLLLGSDPVLLSTRRDILERFGYAGLYLVVTDIAALPSLRGILVVHLCQTIDPAQAAELARQVRALYPGVAVLYTESLRQPEPQEFDELLPPLLPPRAYARMVGALLEAQP